MKELIDVQLVELNLTAATREQVIELLARKLEQDQRLTDKASYIQTVMEREALFSTAVAEGVAIPHGKSTAVDIPSIAMARLVSPVSWTGGESVQFVFLLAVPDAEAGDMHLRILAKLSRQLMSEDFLAQLAVAEEKENVVALILATEQVA